MAAFFVKKARRSSGRAISLSQELCEPFYGFEKTVEQVRIYEVEIRILFRVMDLVDLNIPASNSRNDGNRRHHCVKPVWGDVRIPMRYLVHPVVDERSDRPRYCESRINDEREYRIMEGKEDGIYPPPLCDHITDGGRRTVSLHPFVRELLRSSG